jgi:hypothetical protein
MTSTRPQIADEPLDARRRAMIFGFGALTTAAAIDAINGTAMASEPFRRLLLAEAAGPAPDSKLLTKGAIRYKPLVDKLDGQFASVKLASSMGDQLRRKFHDDLKLYKFSGFVADPSEDANNSWQSNPAQFRQDSSDRFPPAELSAFEQSMRENFRKDGKTPALDWPIHFFITQGDVGDGKSHILLVKDSTGAPQWFCVTICYDP